MLARPRSLTPWAFGFALVGVTGLVACGTSSDSKPTDHAAQPAQPAEPAQPPPLDKAALEMAAVNTALVPSPAEMQKALSSAGIQASLASLVPARNLKMDIPNKDQVAVRTGVVLADMLLTVPTAEKDKLVAQLGQVKAGMGTLGGGADIQATLDDIAARVQNDAVSRDELLKELDEMSGAVIPEIQYEAGEWAVPLIQAGSWLAGANLVAGALLQSGNVAPANDLLRQPAVVDHFLKYVRAEGQNKAPSQVVSQLEATLTTLKEIAAKEALTEEDVKTVQSATASVLDLL